MPLYEYVCKSCDHRFDEFQHITEFDPSRRPPCPKCNQTTTVERVFAAAKVVSMKDGYFQPAKQWDEVPVPRDVPVGKDGVVQIDHNDGRLL